MPMLVIEESVVEQLADWLRSPNDGGIGTTHEMSLNRKEKKGLEKK